jgi:hypothetical protein
VLGWYDYPLNEDCAQIAESTGLDFITVYTIVKLLKGADLIDERGVNSREVRAYKPSAGGIYSLTEMLLLPENVKPVPLSLDMESPARKIVASARERHERLLEEYADVPLTPQLLIGITRPLFQAICDVAWLVTASYMAEGLQNRRYTLAVQQREEFEASIVHQPDNILSIKDTLLRFLQKSLSQVEVDYLDRLLIAKLHDGKKDSNPDWKKDSKAESVLKRLSLDVVNLSDLKPELLVWLWPNVVPMRCVTIFAGDPGVGKSLMGLDMAARGSVGANFLNGALCDKPFETRLLMLEDDKSTIIVPRLMAMGADLTKVACVEGMSRKNLDEGEDDGQRLVILQQDMTELSNHLTLHPDVKLVIIDPVSNYMKGDNDMYTEAFRKVLTPLSKLAQEHDIAVVVVMHNSKQPGRKALSKVGANLGGIGVARIAWTFMMRDDGHHAMLQMKMNLGRFDGIVYTTKGVPVEIEGVLTDQASMVFVEVSKVDADIATGEADDFEGKRDSKGEAFLRKLLPRPDSVIGSVALYAAADAIGIAKRTMERVVANLLVGSGKKNQERIYGWKEKHKNEVMDEEKTDEELTLDSPFV